MLTRADLKLPPNFNGIGMHYDSEGVKGQDEYLNDEYYRQRVDSDFQLMADLGITCVTVLDARDYIYQLATRHGMLVLNRPFRRAYQPYTGDGDPVGTAHRNGHAALVQLNNEDVLGAEWDNEVINWYVSAAHLVNASSTVYDQGGIVCWQMLDFRYFKFCVDRVKEAGAERIFDRFMFIPHPYGINHPYDYQQDENAALGWLFWADVIQQKIGFVPYMIAGEWGWGLNESADNRYPAVTDELRTQYEMACYDSLRTGLLPGGVKLPDYFLAYNKWIWHARGRTYWEDDAILKSDGSRRESFVNGLLAIPKFVRRFGDENQPQPTPEPPPTPIPEPEEPPTPEPPPSSLVKWKVFDRTGRQRNAYGGAEFALNFARVIDGYVQPAGAAPLDFVNDTAAEVGQLRQELIATQAELATAEEKIAKVRETLG